MSDYWPVYSMLADGYTDQTSKPSVSERTAVHIRVHTLQATGQHVKEILNLYIIRTVYIIFLAQSMLRQEVHVRKYRAVLKTHRNMIAVNWTINLKSV
jgi:hypothetical protein